MTTPDRGGRLPLHYAALENNVADAEARIAAGDDVSFADKQGFTPLHFAAQENALDVARTLLDNGAAIDPVNRFGNTPLWIAVMASKGRGDLIALLRERGADPYRANDSDVTPVALARMIGNYPVAQYFADLPE